MCIVHDLKLFYILRFVTLCYIGLFHELVLELVVVLVLKLKISAYLLKGSNLLRHCFIIYFI